MKTLKFDELPELEQSIMHEKAYKLIKFMLPDDAVYDFDRLAEIHVDAMLFHECAGSYYEINLIEIK